MRFEIDIAPRLDYGRRKHETVVTENGAVFRGGDLALTLHAVREPGDARLAHGQIDDGDLRISLDLDAGQVRGLVLESASEGPPRELRVAEI